MSAGASRPTQHVRHLFGGGAGGAALAAVLLVASAARAAPADSKAGTMTVTVKKKKGPGTAAPAKSPEKTPAKAPDKAVATPPSKPEPAAQAAPTPSPPPPPATPPPAATPVVPVARPVEKPTVAVLDVDSTIPNEKLDTSAFTEVLVSSFDQAGAFRVISSKELATLLGAERQRALAGCSEDGACMAELGAALGAQFLAQASVGKVGQNYLVSARLFDAKHNHVVGRASVQAHDPNSLFEAVWRVSQQVLDTYGSVLPPDESAKWASRTRATPPTAVVTASPGASDSSVGVVATVLGGYEPLAEKGRRGSVGGEVDVAYRTGRLEVSLGIIVSPYPGARFGLGYAVLTAPLRLTVGARGAAFPTGGAFGGGLGVCVELPLGSTFAVLASGGAEVYPSSGLRLALTGQTGVAARF